MFTFVTGGFRSGRSNYALRRAAELGPPPWLYTTAGEETDEAIQKRIAHQRKDSEAIWRTSVMPGDLSSLLDPELVSEYGAIVLDGIPGWIAARLGRTPPEQDAAFLDEIANVAETLYRLRVPAVVVSQEFSLGTVPETDYRFVKAVASANQILAGQAGSIVLMVSGVPMRVR